MTQPETSTPHLELVAGGVIGYVAAPLIEHPFVSPLGEAGAIGAGA